MGGGGSLDSMNKSLKYNRNLLKKRRGFEVLKENFSRKKNIRIYKYKKASKAYLSDLRQSVKRDRRMTSIRSLFLFIILLLVIGFLFYKVFQLPQKNTNAEKYRVEYYKSITYPLDKSMVLKVEYFDQGHKAAETKLLFGMKHQNSESWYPTGEQFRSAAYWKDTLITEVFFYPNGDTLKNFSKYYNNDINFVRLSEPRGELNYSFYYSDGKILPGSFRIY
jgi:hypothetical protein